MLLLMYTVVNDEIGQFRLKAGRSHIEFANALQFEDFEETRRVIKKHIMDNLPSLLLCLNRGSNKKKT